MSNKIDIKLIHKHLLVLAAYFDNFCRKYGITYYLMGGTALGAIRHKGFIPWDDDFDIFMDFENYNKFLNEAEKHLDTNLFYLQKEATDEWPLYFSKLRMNNTTYLEADTIGRNMHQGLFIDIICLNNGYSNSLLRYLQYVSARILSANALARRGYSTNDWFKRLAMLIAKYAISEAIRKFLAKFVRYPNKLESKVLVHFFGRASFYRAQFSRDVFGVPRYVPFENIYLPVPEHVEQYLEARFGIDFMKMPSRDVRDKYPSHVVLFDPDRGYEFPSKIRLPRDGV